MNENLFDLQPLQAEGVARNGDGRLCNLLIGSTLAIQRAFAQLFQTPASIAGSDRGAQEVGGVR